ncbi:hypothetical protein HELRODRAFT_171419 [Helobdella robusta]|uniref:Uncharacterized protein n=1 Tax=Helobdella robusta TaxID=6412 RepID=T1F493_HELRO|nr:hypothetical protein HELRODRAFT_171419 [Helobdella robusta]ESO05751.1 hypothetical protein HELRODRAFT_171419 [Helobdella robusta]
MKGRQNKVNNNSLQNQIFLKIGSQINCNFTPFIMFIFGGPGSNKGLIVNNLVSCFDFNYISSEETFLDAESEKFVESADNFLIADWLMSKLKEEIMKDRSLRYLVDLVPNKKPYLSNQLKRKEFVNYLFDFELELPISCGLNLSVHNENVTTKKKATKTHSTSGNKGDEADILRMQKRSAQYEQGVKNMVEYFDTLNKLITMDVPWTSRNLADVWTKLHDILCQFNIQPKKSVDSVFIFTLGDQITPENNLMKSQLIDLSADVTNDTTIDSWLEAVIKRVDTSFNSSGIFIINIPATIYDHRRYKIVENLKPKNVCFRESNALHGLLHNILPNFTYKAVTTLENETWVFPLRLDNKFCSHITNKLTSIRKCSSS